MSETTAYLIPKKHFDVGEFEAKIKAAFKRLELINGYYDEGSKWFAAGDSAHSLFADTAVDDNPPFEYVEVHDTENKRLLPEGLQEPANCPFCQADISENVNDFLFETTEKEYDEKNEIDMADAELTCPNCRKKTRLSTLTYREKVAFSNQYVCFVAILDNINEKKLIEIEQQLGSSFEIIYGSI
ncbi:MAG: hypothetical protein EOP48_04760 [Sphingobacteriales bacterium]|nr:MAG: hypothetical protein EOP48_04760 [Sphingobacteriales bacterium]